MIDQIISCAGYFNRGMEAFYRGADRDAHHLDPESKGLPHWLEGYDQAARASLLKPQAEIVKAKP